MPLAGIRKHCTNAMLLVKFEDEIVALWRQALFPGDQIPNIYSGRIIHDELAFGRCARIRKAEVKM